MTGPKLCLDPPPTLHGGSKMTGPNSARTPRRPLSWDSIGAPCRPGVLLTFNPPWSSVDCHRQVVRTRCGGGGGSGRHGDRQRRRNHTVALLCTAQRKKDGTCGIGFFSYAGRYDHGTAQNKTQQHTTTCSRTASAKQRKARTIPVLPLHCSTREGWHLRHRFLVNARGRDLRTAKIKTQQHTTTRSRTASANQRKALSLRERTGPGRQTRRARSVPLEHSDQGCMNNKKQKQRRNAHACGTCRPATGGAGQVHTTSRSVDTTVAQERCLCMETVALVFAVVRYRFGLGSAATWRSFISLGGGYDFVVQCFVLNFSNIFRSDFFLRSNLVINLSTPTRRCGTVSRAVGTWQSRRRTDYSSGLPN